MLTELASAGVSLLGGLFSSRSASKLSKRQLALQQQALDFNKARYAEAKAQYQPVINLATQMATDGVKADLGGVTSRAAADMSQQFKNADAQILMNQQRMGINPNSGMAQAQARQSALSQALGTAGAVTAARDAERRNAEQQTWARRSAMASMGQSAMTGTANDVTNGMNNMANSYGNMAAGQSAAAGNLLAGAGSMIGGMAANGGFNGLFGRQTAQQPMTMNLPTNFALGNEVANGVGVVPPLPVMNFGQFGQ